MKVTDAQLAEVFDRGFTMVEGFLDAEALAAAREGVWQHFPRPDDYFAEPEKWPQFRKSQFAAMRYFPFNHPALDVLVVHPDLVDAAERFCGTPDIELYKVELWAKYAGAIDYDQPHHRDYGNHTIVVPTPDAPQMTTFLLLSDVTEADGPTKVVPLEHTRDLPLVPQVLEHGALFEQEVPVTGPAGTLLIYKTDVLHRASNLTGPQASRFVLLCDYHARGQRWRGKQAWPDHAIRPGWTEALTAMSPRQRDLFGWPPPGDAYWTAQTLAGVAARYPGMDLTPYRRPA